MHSFADASVSAHEKKLVWLSVCIYTLISLFVLLFARINLPKMDNFAAFCSLLISFSCLQTAYLLYNQSKLTEDASLNVLASGYFVTSSLTAAYTLVFPNLFISFADPDRANQAVSWLWIFSHLLFPAFIMLFTVVKGKKSIVTYGRSQRLFKLSPLMAAFFVGLAIHAIHLLPSSIEGDSYSSGFGLGLTWVVFFTNLCALNLFFQKMDLSNRQNLWLLLALIVYQLDVTYSLAGGERYTLGWYIAKVNNVVSSGLILAVFNYHIISITKGLKDANSALNQIATTDSLTQLSNRRKFLTTLENYWNLGLQEQKPLCLIMLDVDHFKKFNDQFGHPAGDECLRQIALTMRQIFQRENDIIARIGGEEFAILVYNMDEKIGARMAERLRHTIEKMQFNTSNFEGHHVTISLGCTSVIPARNLLSSNILSVGDQALYKAKHQGRNQVHCSSEIFT